MFSYQFAVILLIYLLPLLVMLVTYSLVGRSLWGGHIPGEATEHYHSQITAKRKVELLYFSQILDVKQVIFYNFYLVFICSALLTFHAAGGEDDGGCGGGFCPLLATLPYLLYSGVL